MKKTILIFVSLMFIRMYAFTQQSFIKQFDQTYIYSVQQTTDTGFIITGATGNFSTPYIGLIKTDKNGDTLWTKKYGNPNTTNIGYAVQQTFDGGYVVAGISNTSIGPYDIYLMKTNSTGDTLWTKSYGSPGNDYAYSIKQTTDSGFIIAGSIDYNGLGRSDAFLIKTNAHGDTLWTKSYGGDSIEYANAVELTTDGGFIFIGYTNSFGTNSYDFDIYLIKTDSIGDTLWTKTFGTTDYDYVILLNKQRMVALSFQEVIKMVFFI
jgi:hypothetical protein